VAEYSGNRPRQTHCRHFFAQGIVFAAEQKACCACRNHYRAAAQLHVEVVDEVTALHVDSLILDGRRIYSHEAAGYKVGRAVYFCGVVCGESAAGGYEAMAVFHHRLQVGVALAYVAAIGVSPPGSGSDTVPHVDFAHAFGCLVCLEGVHKAFCHAEQKDEHEHAPAHRDSGEDGAQPVAAHGLADFAKEVKHRSRQFCRPQSARCGVWRRQRRGRG